MTGYWAVAQTVSKMEHIVRREIEKTSHGAFLPTYAKHWKVDGRDYSDERALLTGYVFFQTRADDWAGIPDIHGVYGVLTGRVQPNELKRLMVDHACGQHNETGLPRYTRYYRPPSKKSIRYKSRKPRPGNRIRNIHAQ